MRIRLLTIGLLFALLLVPFNPLEKIPEEGSRAPNQPVIESHCLISDVSASGNNFDVTMFMSRKLTDQSFNITNSYANPNHHNGSLDLSLYHLSGWNLYKAELDLENLTAIEEKETIGVTDETPLFRIYEIGGLANATQLAQGFYNQPHNGSLVNYSIYYSSPTYDTSTYGYAYFVVRSDYTSSSSNMTNPIAVTDVGGSKTWTTISSTTNLTESSVYYAVIDGNALIKSGVNFPDIQWHSENSAGTFATYRYLREFTSWGSQSYEALMNYTYIPWNQTTNSALLFQPSELSLRANSSVLNGNSWMWTGNNLTLLNFDSSQSVSTYFNLTLWYKKDTTSSSTWKSKTPVWSGINWNLTSTLSYPSGQSEKYVNFTKMTDWSFSTIYNGSTTIPKSIINYPEVVILSDMTNGSWTLSGGGPNYMNGGLFITDQSTTDSLPTKASITTDLNLTTSIVTSSGNPGVGGTANITVMNSTHTVWTDEQAAVNNRTVHLWDISTSTTKNGTYTIEAYWENGTEAGYYIQEYVIYLPTSLTTSSSSISAYTDNSFNIDVEFVDTFSSIGLNSTYAQIEYSFNGETNVSMNPDQENGTWIATIDTAGRAPGTYDIDVYAQGTAIENQTLTITVTLLHQTNPLIVQWTNTNSITYVETTTLQVRYQNATNSAYLTSAEVNVTDGITTWDLNWNSGSQYFEIQFNGSDSNPGFGSHGLTISAWLSGYEEQSDASQILDISIESTSGTPSWTAPHSNSITYVEYTVLRFDYQMSNSSSVLDATVNVTDGITYWDLQWNQTSGYYEIQFNGTDANPGFGVHSLSISAWKYGYQEQTPAVQTLTIQVEPTIFNFEWTSPHLNDITYIEYTTLRVNYTMSNGTPIVPATVNVTDGTTTWTLLWNGTSGFYEIQFNGTDVNPGVGTHSLTIKAGQYGYQNQQPPDETLYISEEPTTITSNWDTFTITYTDSVILRFNFTDSYGTLIPNADQRDIYINTTQYVLSGGGNGTYWYILDNTLGLGYFEIWVNISEANYEFTEYTGITFTINEEITSWTITWEPTNVTLPYTYALNLSIDYTYSGGDVPATDVNVTIDGTVYPLSYVTDHWYVSIEGDILGVGVYTAMILADLYGYQNQSNVTSNVNITLAANSFIVTPNTDLTISYVDSVEITVTYTYDYNPILGATVRLILNGSTYDLTYFAGDQMWHYTLTGTTADLGMSNATVIANKTGYETGIDQFNLTVIADATSIDTLWDNKSVEYIYDTDLSVNLTSTIFTLIDDATVTMTINGSSLAVMNHNNGTYTAVIDNLMDLGLYIINISISRYGIVDAYKLLNLTIIEAQSVLDVSISNTTPYFDGSISINITYTLLNTTLIDPMNITVELDGVNQTLTWATDHWELSYVAADLGIGTYQLFVNTTAYGFEGYTLSQQLEILAIPTQLTGFEGQSLFVNDTESLVLTYLDTRTSSALDIDTYSIEWDGSYILSPSTGSAYILEISTTGINSGQYEFRITITTLGHSTIDRTISIEVLEVTSEISFIDIIGPNINIYQNETLSIQLNFTDTVHDATIHWANVSLELDGMLYLMDYDNQSELYIISIWLDYEVFTDDIYTLRFEANATDCTSAIETLSLFINPKTLYTLTVDASERVVAGSELSATVSVTIDGTPQQFVSVDVFFRLSANESSSVISRSVTTNQEGFGTVAIAVAEGTTLVEIWAEILGTEEVWHVTTSIVGVEVDPAPDLVTLIIGYISSPLGILVLLFVGLVASSGFYYRKKVQPKKRATMNSLLAQQRIFEDLQAIQHFMAVYLNRGTCVFYNPFGETRIQADLISGFIAAVTSVYGEIKGDGVQGTLEEIQYQGLRLNSYNGKFVLGILILDSEISQTVRQRLQFFVEMFENEYESYLDGWTGITDCFDPEWILSNFISTFNYGWVLPQTLQTEMKMTGEERKIVKYIQSSVGESREFLIADYIDGVANLRGKTEAESLDTLLRMQEKGIFHPISVHSFLMRQGFGLPEGDIELDDAIEVVDETEEPLDEVIEKVEMIDEEKSEAKETESVEEQEVSEPSDPKEDFVAEVESLLKKDKENDDDD